MWRSESTDSEASLVTKKTDTSASQIQQLVLQTQAELGLTGIRFSEDTKEQVFSDKGLKGRATSLEGSFSEYPKLLSFLKSAQAKGIAITSLEVKDSAFKATLVQLSPSRL